MCVWWWSLACGVAAVLARNNNNNSHHYYIIKFIRHAWPFSKKKERATARCCHKNERRSRREGLILFLSHLAQACQIWTEEELSNREASRSLPCCCCVVVVSGWNAFFFLLFLSRSFIFWVIPHNVGAWVFHGKEIGATVVISFRKDCCASAGLLAAEERRREE